MRLVNGKWICRLCGSELLAPPGQRPRTMILGVSGRKNVRAVYLGPDEIHRCESSLDTYTY